MSVVLMPDALDYDEIKSQLYDRIHNAPDNERAAQAVTVWWITDQLACIVIYPKYLCDGVEEAMIQSFQRGASDVWLVASNIRRIQVHHSDRTIVVFNTAKTLTAPDILPGFELPLADLFPEAKP